MTDYNKILFINKLWEGYLCLDSDKYEDLFFKFNDFLEKRAKLAKKEGAVIGYNYEVGKLGHFIDTHFHPLSPLHYLPFCTGAKAHNPKKALTHLIEAFNDCKFTNEEIQILINAAENQEPGTSSYISNTERDYRIFELSNRIWITPNFYINLSKKA
jgi:hypothetical protein